MELFCQQLLCASSIIVDTVVGLNPSVNTDYEYISCLHYITHATIQHCRHYWLIIGGVPHPGAP